MSVPRGGGNSKRSSPPGKSGIFFSLYGGAFLLLFLHVRAFYATYLSLWGAFSTCEDPFSPYGCLFTTVFSMFGAFFVFMGSLFCAYPPTKIFVALLYVV